MAVRDVSDVMPEGNCFDEILIEPQRTSDGAGDFRNKLDVDDPVGDMIIIDKVKDLCLIDISGICPGVDNAVRVPGIGCTDILGFSVMPAKSIGTCRGQWR